MNDIMDFGEFTDIKQISLQMVISYTNKFSSLNALLLLFTVYTEYLQNIHAEQNQNGIKSVTLYRWS